MFYDYFGNKKKTLRSVNLNKLTGDFLMFIWELTDWLEEKEKKSRGNSLSWGKQCLDDKVLPNMIG